MSDGVVKRDYRYWKQFKEELLKAAPGLGIDKLGVTTAEPFHELKERLLRHRERGHESGFEEPDLDLRTDPSLHMAEAKSIIAIAVAYPSKLKNAPDATIARRRVRTIDNLILDVGGLDEEGELHWSPLRDSLTIEEAELLLERLKAAKPL